MKIKPAIQVFLSFGLMIVCMVLQTDGETDPFDMLAGILFSLTILVLVLGEDERRLSETGSECGSNPSANDEKC